MKKKRTISITNPKLRRFRDSLRGIVSKVVIEEIGNTIKQKGEIIKELQQNSENNILYKKKLELINKRDKLDTAWKNSICVCPVCGSRTSDMTFNPHLKAWFCVDCYEKNRQFYIKRGEPHIYP